MWNLLSLLIGTTPQSTLFRAVSSQPALSCSTRSEFANNEKSWECSRRSQLWTWCAGFYSGVWGFKYVHVMKKRYYLVPLTIDLAVVLIIFLSDAALEILQVDVGFHLQSMVRKRRVWWSSAKTWLKADKCKSRSGDGLAFLETGSSWNGRTPESVHLCLCCQILQINAQLSKIQYRYHYKSI